MVNYTKRVRETRITPSLGSFPNVLHPQLFSSAGNLHIPLNKILSIV